MPPSARMPAADALAHSARPEWQRADVFRAVLFGIVGVIYALLMLPLTVAVAVLWAVTKLLDAGTPPAR